MMAHHGKLPIQEYVISSCSLAFHNSRETSAIPAIRTNLKEIDDQLGKIKVGSANSRSKLIGLMRVFSLAFNRIAHVGMLMQALFYKHI